MSVIPLEASLSSFNKELHGKERLQISLIAGKERNGCERIIADLSAWWKTSYLCLGYGARTS
jgi:hypothetical protein